MTRVLVNLVTHRPDRAFGDDRAVGDEDDLIADQVVRGNSELPPAELLHSSKLKSIFQELAARFDLILVDSPPTNLLTDAQLLASACDAVLLVARAFSTSQKALEEAAEQLRPFHMIGCVLNGGPSTRRSYQYGYYK
jgi:Mrp family chromosome partitioning ATPase